MITTNTEYIVVLACKDLTFVLDIVYLNLSVFTDHVSAGH